MEIIRYSDTGFEPQYQSHMAELIHQLKTIDIGIYDNFPAHLRDICRQTHIENLSNLDHDFPLFGYHAFFPDTPDHIIGFYLNHLPNRPKINRCVIADDLLVYELDQPYLRKRIPVCELRKDHRFGCYIPCEKNHT